MEVGNLTTRVSFIVNGAQQAASAARKVADEAERMGTASSEAVDSLNELNDGLEKSSRRLSDVQSQWESARSSIEQTGKSVSAVRSEVEDFLTGFESVQQKIAQNLAVSGSEYLKYLGPIENAFEKFGVTVDKLTRTQAIELFDLGDTVAQLEQFDRLSAQREGLVNSVEEQVQAVAGATRDLSEGLESLPESARQAILQLDAEYQNLQRSIGQVNAEIEVQEGRLRRFSALSAQYSQDEVRAMEERLDRLVQVKRAEEDFQRLRLQQAEGASIDTAELERLEQVLSDFRSTEGITDVGAQIKEISSALQSILSAQSGAISAQESINRGLRERADLERQVSEIVAQRQSIAAGPPAGPSFTNADALAGILPNIDQAVQKLNDYRENVNGMREAWGQVESISEQQLQTLLRNQEAAQTLEEEIRAMVGAANDFADAIERAGGDSRGLNQVRDQLRSVLDGLDAPKRSIESAVEPTTRLRDRLKGMLGTLLNVNNGSILTASGIASLVARLTGLGAVAVGVIQILRGLVRYLSEVVNLAGQASTLGSFVDQAREVELTGAGLLQTATALQDAEQRLSAVGVRGGTGGIADLAESLQYLNKTAGDGPLALQALVSAVESINATPLRQFGVDVRAVNDGLARLAREGASEAERRYYLLTEAQRAVAASSREVVAQAGTEANTIQNLREQVGQIFEEVKSSDEVQAVIKEMVAQLRVALPILRVVAVIIGKLLVNAFQALVDWVDKWLNRLQRLFEILSHLPGVGDDFREAASKLQELRDGAQETVDAFNDLAQAGEEGFGEITDGAETARQKMLQFFSDINQGYQAGDVVKNLGDSLKALQEDANPTNVRAYVQAYTQAFNAVANGALDQQRRLLEFFRNAAQAGAISPEVLAEVERQFDLTERALAPYEQEVNKLKGGADTAAAKVQSLGDSTLVTASNFDTATDSVNTFISTTNNIPTDKTMTVHVNYVQSGTAGISFSYGLPGTTTTTGPARPTDTTGFAAEEARFQRLANDAVGAVKDAATQFKSAAAVAAQAGANRAKFAEENLGAAQALQLRQQNQQGFGAAEGAAIDYSNLFPPSGGGGGGSSLEASIDQIRAFLQEVNRAIAIASNEGVRIGTAGNAIPFEEGSFVNTQGGGLSIDTIIIRGVWDFADPAGKRLIIRELQEALQALGAEV